MTHDITLDFFKNAFIYIHKKPNITRLLLCDVFIVTDRNLVKCFLCG